MIVGDKESVRENNSSEHTDLVNRKRMIAVRMIESESPKNTNSMQKW